MKRTLQKSHGRHTPSVLLEQIQRSHDTVCTDIAKKKQKIKAWSDLQNTKKVSRWRPGLCVICGEHMDYCITNYHAGLHGYKSADALIRAGKIIFD